MITIIALVAHVLVFVVQRFQGWGFGLLVQGPGLIKAIFAESVLVR